MNLHTMLEAIISYCIMIKTKSFKCPPKSLRLPKTNNAENLTR